MIIFSSPLLHLDSIASLHPEYTDQSDCAWRFDRFAKSASHSACVKRGPHQSRASCTAAAVFMIADSDDAVDVLADIVSFCGCMSHACDGGCGHFHAVASGISTTSIGCSGWPREHLSQRVCFFPFFPLSCLIFCYCLGQGNNNKKQQHDGSFVASAEPGIGDAVALLHSLCPSRRPLSRAIHPPRIPQRRSPGRLSLH